MSRSVLKDKWMRKHTYGGESSVSYSDLYHKNKKNGHRKDEAPKNKPSKFVATHGGAHAAWLQEPTSFGGHKVQKAGHRMVSGIVRANVKEETREQVQREMEED